MVLDRKWPVFQLFILGNIGQENVKKSKNWRFSKGANPWFWSKNGHFSTFFFLSNIGQENAFSDIQDRKYAFLGYKNKKFKESKNSHFSKGFNPWFWSKNGHFSIFFFRKYRPDKCVLRYSRTKKLLSWLWKQEDQEVQKVEELTFFQRG